MTREQRESARRLDGVVRITEVSEQLRIVFHDGEEATIDKDGTVRFMNPLMAAR